jgi:zinc/manganese transport system permease protein
MNPDALDFGILGPALCAGLLVLATHVPMGQLVLARGIVFIDLAIAQIAALGVIAAGTLGWEPGGFSVQLAATGAALLGALIFSFTEKHWPALQEALIGALFVLAACAGILLLAGNPHGGEHLKDLLVGQILWVNYAQLLPVALLTAVILAVWFGARVRPGRIGFYAMFAVAVTASVQLVGIYLVFASLILPALATYRLEGAQRLTWGYAAGASGYAIGITTSALFDLPTGAVTVWALALAAIATALLVPRLTKRREVTL